MKKTLKEAFVFIFRIYWEGLHFSRRLKIAKLDKMLDTEIDFETLY